MNLVRRAAALFGMALFGAGGARAQSQALAIELAWDGPPSCPVSDDIQRDVRRFLGDAALPSPLEPIAARVAVRETSDRRLDVRMVTTSGGETRERALSTETCDEARDLVAFLLALLIDPNAKQPSLDEAPKEKPVEKPPPPAATVTAELPRAPPVEDNSVQWVVGLSGSAVLGLLPEVGAGGEVRAGLLLSGWSLEARGGAFLPRRARSTNVPGAGGRFTVFDAGLLGCWRGGPWDAVAFGLCAGPLLLTMQGEGYGVTTPGRDDALFGALSAEGALVIAISRWLSLRPALGALVPLRRPTFSIRDVGPIHRPGTVAALGSLGLEARF